MPQKKLKILVIDDDPEICKFLKAGLGARGNYKVLVAKGGKMGTWLALCRWHRPDLIILDIIMEQVDGFKVLRRIRQNKEASYIPIIILTGRTDYASKIKAEGMYCDDYIVKPVSLEELKSRIENLLAKRGIIENKEE